MNNYLYMMNQWLILKQEGKSIARYLERNSFSSVAVYGMAIYGRHVVRDLQGTAITVAYGIDQKKMKPYLGVEIMQPTGALPQADVIINSVIRDHMNIKAALSQITDIPVISLEEVVFGSYE